jgi:hypothetical protein
MPDAPHTSARVEQTSVARSDASRRVWLTDIATEVAVDLCKNEWKNGRDIGQRRRWAEASAYVTKIRGCEYGGRFSGALRGGCKEAGKVGREFQLELEVRDSPSQSRRGTPPITLAPRAYRPRAPSSHLCITVHTSTGCSASCIFTARPPIPALQK